MKRKVDSLDSKMLYYTVLVVAMLNLYAYISVSDWTSCIVFVVAAVGMSVFNSNKTMILFVAILVAALNKTVYTEGMDTDKPKKSEKGEKGKKSEPEPAPPASKTQGVAKVDALTKLREVVDSPSSFEGLAVSADKLADSQKNLSIIAGQIGPMMKKAESMMKSLPEGFLEKAMQNLNNNKLVK